jgi:hypothetical protein
MFFSSCILLLSLLSLARGAALDVATATVTVSGACQENYWSTIVLTAPVATATADSPATTTITEDISIVWKEKRATKTVTETVCTPYTNTVWVWTTDAAYTSTQTDYAATSTAYKICGEGLPAC